MEKLSRYDELMQTGHADRMTQKESWTLEGKFISLGYSLRILNTGKRLEFYANGHLRVVFIGLPNKYDGLISAYIIQ